MPRQTRLPQIKEELHRQLPTLAQRYGVRSLRMFGSYVRHQQRPDSDLDLLVTFVEPPSLLKFIELENYLSDLLGMKVDLVMADALRPRIAERILGEAVAVEFAQAGLRLPGGHPRRRRQGSSVHTGDDVRTVHSGYQDDICRSAGAGNHIGYAYAAGISTAQVGTARCSLAVSSTLG